MEIDISDFSKTCRKNLSLIKIQQEYRLLYMKTFSHLWQYFATLYLERETFHKKLCGKSKHTLCSVILLSKIVPFMRQCRKIWWSQRGHEWRHNMAHMRCMLEKTRLHALRRMHTPTRPSTLTHACSHTHARTQICNTYCFFKATMITDCTSILRYTYVVSLVPAVINILSLHTPCNK